MSDTSSHIQTPSDSNLSPAQNPQTPGGQALAKSATNNTLQSTATLQGASQQLSITSVGDSSFTPFDSSSASTSQLVLQPKPAQHHYPIIIGGVAVVVVCLACTWWMTIKARARL